MARRTLIGKLAQKRFIITYILLNFLTVLFIAITLMDLAGMLMVLVAMFLPMALFVYEAVITVARLHDIDRSTNYVFLLYFKYELVKRLFYSQYDLILIISAIVYFGFILFLMMQKSKGGALIASVEDVE